VTFLEAGLEFTKKQISPDNGALAGIYFHLSMAYRKTGKDDAAIELNLKEAFGIMMQHWAI
jgi:hypothetical protein